MRIATIALLIVFGSIYAPAQVDNLTSIKILVRDFADRPVKKADFQVRQLRAEKTQPYEMENIFKVEDAFVVHLGLEARGSFLIEISADGFEPLAFKVFFARGHMQTVIAKLRRTGSSERAEIERITNLNGQVLDYAGSLITNAKVVAVDQKGRRFETTSSPNGYFELKLPFIAFFFDSKLKQWTGDASEPLKYDFSVVAPGFKIFQIKQLIVTNGAEGDLNLDVVLGLMDPSPGGAIIRKQKEELGAESCIY